MLCPWTPSDAGVSSSLSCSSVLPPLPALLLRQTLHSPAAHLQSGLPCVCRASMCSSQAPPACSEDLLVPALWVL